MVYLGSIQPRAYRAHIDGVGLSLWIASSYEWLVHDLKSEDIIYIREIFPDTTSMAPGGGAALGRRTLRVGGAGDAVGSDGGSCGG